MADADQDVDAHLLGKVEHLFQRGVVDAPDERDTDAERGRRERDILRRRPGVEQREDLAALPSHRRLRAVEIGADDDDRDGVGEEARGDVPHRLHQPRVADDDQPPHELVAAHRRERRRLRQPREHLLGDGVAGEAPVHPPPPHRLEDVQATPR